jgi:hypothetical protein
MPLPGLSSGMPGVAFGVGAFVSVTLGSMLGAVGSDESVVPLAGVIGRAFS